MTLRAVCDGHDLPWAVIDDDLLIGEETYYQHVAHGFKSEQEALDWIASFIDDRPEVEEMRRIFWGEAPS
jgi:hypothetical protein